MKVVCAWCETEGKETLIGEIGLYDIEVTSHGICIDHEKVLLNQIKELRLKQNPRLRRPRRPRIQPRSLGFADVTELHDALAAAAHASNGCRTVEPPIR